MCKGGLSILLARVVTLGCQYCELVAAYAAGITPDQVLASIVCFWLWLGFNAQGVSARG